MASRADDQTTVFHRGEVFIHLPQQESQFDEQKTDSRETEDEYAQDGVTSSRMRILILKVQAFHSRHEFHGGRGKVTATAASARCQTRG